MDYNAEKNIVTIFGKNEKLDTLTNRLASLSGEQVYGFFINRGIAIPRKMNCMALTSVINEKLKGLYASDLSKDYFQRLKHYKEFSEVQLYNLFTTICNTKDEFKQYRVNLFKLIIINYVGLNLMDGELKYLKDLKKLPVEPFDQYFQYVSSMCQEQENTFDGQDMDLLRELLVSSASQQEIIDLGRKYGIEISASLKKTEFIEYIKYYLNHTGELNKALEYEINSSTVAGLNSICKKYRIPMSSSMNKNELVTYLFYVLGQCEIVNTSVRRIESMKMYEPLDFKVDLSAFRGFYADDEKRVIIYKGMEEDNPLFYAQMPTRKKASEPKEETFVVNDLSLNKANTNKKPEIKEQGMESISTEEAKEEPLEEEVEDSTDAIAEEAPEEVQEEVIEEQVEEPLEEEVEEPEEVVEEIIEETHEENAEEQEEEIIYVDEDGNPVEYNEDIHTEVIEEDQPQDQEIKEEDVPTETKEETEEPKEKDDESKEDALENKEVLSMDDVRENENYGNDKLMKASKGPGKTIALTVLGVAGAAIIAFILWALLR